MTEIESTGELAERFKRLGRYDLFRTVNLINSYISACLKVKRMFIEEITRRYLDGEIKDLSELNYQYRKVIEAYIRRKTAREKSSLDGWYDEGKN